MRSFFGCLVAWLILGLAGGGCWVKKEVGQRLQAACAALKTRSTQIDAIELADAPADFPPLSNSTDTRES